MINFRDSEGVEWQVFRVTPHANCSVERRRTERRRGENPFYHGPERRRGVDRRRFGGGSLSDGWLCFVSGEVKRRLFGFPPDWRELSESDLEMLLRLASPAGKAPA